MKKIFLLPLLAIGIIVMLASFARTSGKPAKHPVPTYAAVKAADLQSRYKLVNKTGMDLSSTDLVYVLNICDDKAVAGGPRCTGPFISNQCNCNYQALKAWAEAQAAACCCSVRYCAVCEEEGLAIMYAAFPPPECEKAR